MDAILQPTSFRLSQDQTGNPNSSSSSLYCSFSNKYDQMNHFDMDDMLHSNYNPDTSKNPNPNLPQFIEPPSYQDYGSLDFATYITMDERTPIMLDMTTAANTSESSDISLYATCIPQVNIIHRQVLINYVPSLS